MNGYDRLAGIYDVLVRLIFWQRLWKAQQWAAGHIQPESTVLIVGGGTGRILQWVPESANVIYVESSSGMILRAKRRVSRLNVKWIQADFFKWTGQEKADWIILPFFLDQFGDDQVWEVAERMLRYSNSGARLAVIDFQSHKRWHQWLLSIMYLFFSLTVRLPVQELPNYQLLAGRWKAVKEKTFFRKMVFSGIYIRKGHGD